MSRAASEETARLGKGIYFVAEEVARRRGEVTDFLGGARNFSRRREDPRRERLSRVNSPAAAAKLGSPRGGAGGSAIAISYRIHLLGEAVPDPSVGPPVALPGERVAVEVWPPRRLWVALDGVHRLGLATVSTAWTGIPVHLQHELNVLEGCRMRIEMTDFRDGECRLQLARLGARNEVPMIDRRVRCLVTQPGVSRIECVLTNHPLGGGPESRTEGAVEAGARRLLRFPFRS